MYYFVLFNQLPKKEKILRRPPKTNCSMVYMSNNSIVTDRKPYQVVPTIERNNSITMEAILIANLMKYHDSIKSTSGQFSKILNLSLIIT